MSRQQRRIQLKKSVDGIARRGMDLSAPAADQSWAVIAATRILYDILSTKSPSRASLAARRAHEFFEQSLKHNPSKQPVECAKGCAFCCHVSVTAFAPEVLLVANHIRQEYKDRLGEYLDRIRMADSKTRGLDAGERAARRIPCALLDQNMCTVYSVRPSSCRAVASVSVKACEGSFNGENVRIDTPPVWRHLKNAHRQALWAGLAAAQLPTTRYEYHHALRVALETKDAESRWLKGEDIFEGCAHEYFDDPAANAQNQRVIDTLVAGALGKEFPS